MIEKIVSIEDSHLPCCNTLNRKKRTAYVMQRIENTNQRGLVDQATCQDCHGIAVRIAYMLDRHTSTIIRPTCIQATHNTNPVERRIKHTCDWAIFYHYTFPGLWTFSFSASQRDCLILDGDGHDTPHG